MDKKPLDQELRKDALPNGVSDHQSKSKPLLKKQISEDGKGSVKKKTPKSSTQPGSPDKPTSSGGKSRQRKKKSAVDPKDSVPVTPGSSTQNRVFKNRVFKKQLSQTTTETEYSDLLAKMNSSDNMRKSTKQNRRASIPNDRTDFKGFHNVPSSDSPSSSNPGAKGRKSETKAKVQPNQYRSKTPDFKAGASGYAPKKNISAKRSIKFEPYIPLFQVQQGLKRGEFIEGALRINPRNYEDAYLNSPDGKMDIYIGGMQNRNRALNGDIVVVQINPKQEWKVLCDAIKDYQEKSGKTFAESIVEPVPSVPCQVHTPDPFVRPRPLSSNSWDNTRFQRSPDTLEILGIDKLAKQFESMSVRQKTTKSKRKSKNLKQGKEGSSLKSGTASFSQESSEDCLDKMSPEQQVDTGFKELPDMKGLETQSNMSAENSDVAPQSVLNGETYPPCDMMNISEFSVGTDKNCSDSKWIDHENTVNLIISPEELLQFDGNSILNNTNFHVRNNTDDSSDVDGIIVPPDDLSGDEFTDSASIDSSIGGNLDQVIEDAEFIACQQDAANNNVDIIPLHVENMNTYPNFTATVPIQISTVSTETSTLNAQCKIQYNKSVSPVAAFDAQSDVICLSEVIANDHVNVEENIILEPMPITNFEIPADEKDNNNQCNQSASTKKSRHRRRKKKPNKNIPVDESDNKIEENVNKFVKAFNDIRNLSIDQILQHPEWYRFVQKTGKVIHILERKHSCLTAGSLKLMPDKNVNWALFSPTDSRVPRMMIPMSDCPPNFYHRSLDFANVLFLAEIMEWQDNCNFALGRLVKLLGKSSDIDVQTEGILIENGIDYDDSFDDKVLSCLPEDEHWKVPKSELKTRRDFRHKCLFTIDPATARDMDDAVSCELLHNGNYEIGVHIADVTYFVATGTELDEVAKHRSTSVYLVQKVVPMLPRKLCDDLCSLNPGQDRLTYSVVWEMSPEGVIVDQWIGRSVINSCVKLSYEHAQDMIVNPARKWQESEHPPIYGAFTIKDVIKRVNELNSIAVHIREKRFIDGALRLDQVKLEFTLDSERCSPLGFNVYFQKDSNRLIEEFMLLANMTVAQKIYKTFPSLSLLRRHPPPQPKPMQDVVSTCESMGIFLDAASAGTLQNSIARYGGDDEYSNALVQVLMNLCSKPMNCALYFCTGVLEDDHLFRHYALNVPLYTHFTSPIRRYPDIIVHRLLGAALGYNSAPNMIAVEMQKCATLCNDRKYNAKRISELSGELFLAAFVRNLGTVSTRGMVVGVMDHSFDCLILDMGIIKRVYCDKLPLIKKEYSRSHGISTLNLIWKDSSAEEGKRQSIVIFTLVNVAMNVEPDSLQIKVALVKP